MFDPFPGQNTGQFVGYSSTNAFTSVTLGLGALANPSANNTFTVDTLRRTAVPIPAAVWLFGSGLIGLIGMSRRNKA